MKSMCSGLLVVLSLLWGRHSWADGRLLLMGAELRDAGSHYVYLGALTPLPGNNRLGDGWVQRYWLDTFSYHYDTNGTRINADAYGAEAAIGYQKSTPQQGFGATLGLRYQNTSLSPLDPGNHTKGNQIWPKVQLEGDSQVGPAWRAAGIATYVFSLDGYWLRGRLLYLLKAGQQIGFEAIVQGDPNYDAQKLGLVYAGVKLGERWVLNTRVGYHFQSASNSPYAGIELAYIF